MGSRAKIVGTGMHVPERVVSNDDLSKIMDTTDEWIVARTGIRQRYLAADGELTSDLALKAANRALDDAGCRYLVWVPGSSARRRGSVRRARGLVARAGSATV